VASAACADTALHRVKVCAHTCVRACSVPQGQLQVDAPLDLCMKAGVYVSQCTFPWKSLSSGLGAHLQCWHLPIASRCGKDALSKQCYQKGAAQGLAAHCGLVLPPYLHCKQQGAQWWRASPPVDSPMRVRLAGCLSRLQNASCGTWAQVERQHRTFHGSCGRDQGRGRRWVCSACACWSCPALQNTMSVTHFLRTHLFARARLQLLQRLEEEPDCATDRHGFLLSAYQSLAVRDSRWHSHVPHEMLS